MPKEETKAIAVVSPAELIQQAVAGGADLVKLEKLLELQERWEKNEARKLFAKDFAVAQANILPVVKKKFNKQTQSNYAELANIIESAQPIYTKEGFSVTFNEGDCPKEGHARILADVLHCAGHKEQYHLDIPLDGTGIKGNTNMTPIHGKASCISYGKKYLMCMIWNIPTADNDGQTATVKVSNKELMMIRDLLIAKDMTEKSLIEFLKVDSLENLPMDQYMKAISAINAKTTVRK